MTATARRHRRHRRRILLAACVISSGTTSYPAARAAALAFVHVPPPPRHPAAKNALRSSASSMFQRGRTPSKLNHGPPLPFNGGGGRSSSATSLHASFLPDMTGGMPNLEDLIYLAQSAASDLASSPLSSLSSMSSSGAGPTPSALAILYAAGLLTSFSPCSLGLLPLTVSYISGAAGEREDRAVLLPTIAFAAGLASVFCGLGLSVSLLGGVFGSSASGGGADAGGIVSGGGLAGTILLAALSSGVSVAMGLQLLELIRIPLPSFELNVPTFGQQDEGSNPNGADGGGGTDPAMGAEIAFDDEGNLVPAFPPGDDAAAGAVASSTTTAAPPGSASAAAALFRTFLLGGSSALVASPCATPVLTSILAFVATSRDPTLGAALLFTYTLGYSTPLLVVGATGGQALANAQAAAADGGGSIMATIGRFVTPLTGAVLIWYGTTGFLEAVFGDPSLMGLAPVLD